MKCFLISAALLAGSLIPARAQTALTALQIMQKVDEVIYAPKDKASNLKFILVDKNGSSKEREVEALEKASTHRLIRFLSPADQKGIGFLSLPGGVMYVYLPAFKKVRRIATRDQSSKFAGTDMTNEDLQAKRYAETWDGELVKEEGEVYILQLKPKKETQSGYAKIIEQVRKDNFYPIRVEYYDAGGTNFKVMRREKLEQINGYWVAKETTFEDLKTGHKTILQETGVKFDTGITDDKFSERYLTR
jgi:outer membrane lipoprotein-sorting protein